MSGFEDVIKSGNGNTLILTALIAAAIANALPTPADGLYFSMQQRIKEQLEKGEIIDWVVEDKYTLVLKRTAGGGASRRLRTARRGQ